VTDQPKRCCGKPADTFLDHKPNKPPVWIVNCGYCGKFTARTTKKQAIKDWNQKIYGDIA